MDDAEKSWNCKDLEKKIAKDLDICRPTIDRSQPINEAWLISHELTGYITACEEYDVINRKEKHYLLELISKKRKEVINAAT
jgi:hypothetical protein